MYAWGVVSSKHALLEKMLKVTTDQVIALAGLYQALALVQKIAWQGDTTHSCLVPSIGSTLKINVDNFIEVYGSIGNLHLGLQTLGKTLEKRHDQQVIERTRYAINIMYLEEKLQADSHTMSLLAGKIKHIDESYHSVDESLMEITRDLEEVYRTYISPLGPKIIVGGNPSYLKTATHASMIRALLLAGIRATVLWRQAHGKRLGLLLGRRSILNNIAALQRDS